MRIGLTCLLMAVVLLAGCRGTPRDVHFPSTDQSEEDRLFPVRDGDAWGYIDRQGQLVVPTRFSYAGPFSGDLALVREGDLFGYVDRTGRMVIEPRFEDAMYFSNGRAPVQVNGQWVLIDEDGTVHEDDILNLDPDTIEEHRHQTGQLERFESNNQYGYRDSQGQLVIDPRFDQAWHFSEGLARVKVDGLWGYIDRRGDLIIEPRFAQAWDFSGGLAMVQVDGGIGYIDQEGEYVWRPTR
jgi:hypothetical protein